MFKSGDGRTLSKAKIDYWKVRKDQFYIVDKIHKCFITPSQFKCSTCLFYNWPFQFIVTMSIFNVGDSE